MDLENMYRTQIHTQTVAGAFPSVYKDLQNYVSAFECSVGSRASRKLFNVTLPILAF